MLNCQFVSLRSWSEVPSFLFFHVTYIFFPIITYRLHDECKYTGCPIKKFLNPFCFACTLGHKAKWLQLNNGKTLQVLKKSLVSHRFRPNVDSIFLIFLITYQKKTMFAIKTKIEKISWGHVNFFFSFWVLADIKVAPAKFLNFGFYWKASLFLIVVSSEKCCRSWVQIDVNEHLQNYRKKWKLVFAF